MEKDGYRSKSWPLRQICPHFFGQELRFQLNVLCDGEDLYRFSAFLRHSTRKISKIMFSFRLGHRCSHDRPEKVVSAKVTAKVTCERMADATVCREVQQIATGGGMDAVE